MSLWLFLITGIAKPTSTWVDRVPGYHGVEGNEKVEECATISLDEAKPCNSFYCCGSQNTLLGT